MYLIMWKQIHENRGQLILALLSGLLLTLAFPKTDQGWMAWGAVVPLILAVRRAGHGHAFILGFGSGLVHNLGLVYWTMHTMHQYGNLPAVQAIIVLFLLAAYLALYMGAFATILAWLCPRPGYLIIVAPASWVALEFLRTWLFTGFPWELLGYSQYDHLWIIQMADLFGVYGISGFIIYANAVLAIAILKWLDKTWQGESVSRALVLKSGVALVATAFLVTGYGFFRIRTVDKAIAKADHAKVALVQGNIDQAHKWDPRFQVLTTVKYRNLSLEAAKKGVDLVIWPETATPFYFLDEEILSHMVLDGIRTAGTHFIIGSPSYAAKPEHREYFNSAYLIAPDGKSKGKYDKVHLVPFGEYVPLKRWLPFIHKMVAQVGDFRSGRQGNTLPWRQHHVGIQICYEIIFPALSRAMVQNGAHLLVNITNDAWFGRTSAAFQHFSMAVFRSVENRRYLARAANTGISGFIDPCGRILTTTSLFEEASASAQVALLEERSRYSKWGEWPLSLLTFGILIVIIGQRFKI